MNKGSKYSPNHNDWRRLLKSFSSMILRIVGAGLVLLVGLWLIMASNMGAVYWPHIMSGEVDFWFRMTLLGVGLGMWISIAIWLLWLMLCYFYD